MFSSPPIYSKPNAPKQPRRAAYAVPEVCGPTKGKFCNIAGSPVNTRSGMLRKPCKHSVRHVAKVGCENEAETGWSQHLEPLLALLRNSLAKRLRDRKSTRLNSS